MKFAKHHREDDSQIYKVENSLTQATNHFELIDLEVKKGSTQHS